MTDIGLREAKRRATAHALARAAFDLAVERGVDGFTIDEVAARAGFSRRTFANHFSCKEQAIASLAVERLREGIESMPPVADDAPLLDWLAALARHQLSGDFLPLLRQLQQLAQENESLEPYLADVQVQIRRTAAQAVAARGGGGMSRLSVHILVGAAYGALISVLDGSIPLRHRRDVEPPGPDAVSLDEFLDMVFEHLRSGFPHR